MKLKEAIERLKKLQDWYKNSNMSTTIESSELESICIVLQALEETKKQKDQLMELYHQRVQEIIDLKQDMEDIDLTVPYIQGREDEKAMWRNKIKEKIEEQTKRIDKLLEDMVDKSTGCINISYLSKKEKEEVINKRNCLLVQKATLKQFEEDILKDSNTKVEECWLCKEIETNTYKNESSNKKTRLVFYKETGGTYIIRAWGEDVCEQEITHCPLCGRKLGV